MSVLGIGLDIDGVLADSHTNLVALCNARMGTSYTIEDWTDWGGGEAFRPVLEEVIGAWSREDVRTLAPVPGAVEALKGLHEFYSGLRPHPLFYVITSRPERYRRATWEWLLSLDIDFAGVFFEGDKARLASDLGLSAFVEDNLDMARELANVVPFSVMLDKPWNREDEGGAIRTRNWKETKNILRGAIKYR